MARSPGPSNARHVHVEGLDELLKKLTPELYEAAGKVMLKEIADAGAQSARSSGPRLSGKLRASVQPKVNTRPKPLWAAVKVGAVSQRGYGYPRLLEFSPKHHHRDWLKRAVEKAKGAMSSAIEKAAGAIERTFGG